MLPRWLKDNGYLPPDETLKVISIEHEPIEKDCKIVVHTGKETLTDAYDKLYSAKLNFLNNNYVECIILARGALESAAKNKVGLPLKDHTSFHKLVRELSKLAYGKFPSTVSTYRTLYGVASEVIHGGELKVDLDMTKKLIKGATEFLDVLENELDLKERDKKRILKNILESSDERVPKPNG